MKTIYRCTALLLAVLLLNLQLVNAATVLGKVSVYTSSSSHPEIFPLVSGNKMAYKQQAFIRISGGTLVADKGSVFEALDEGETITFQVERGSIYFRLLPSNVRVSFKTPQGVISSPLIAPASVSIIEGKIDVSQDKTSLEVSQGALEALDYQGISKKVNAGEKLFLAQANIAQILPGTGTGACPEATELINLVGENGIVQEKPLTPYGGVLSGGKVRNAVVVNDNLEIISDANLIEGEQLDIIGLVVNKDNVMIDQEFLAKHPQLDVKKVGGNVNECTLLVQPLDTTEPLDEVITGLLIGGLIACAIWCEGDGGGGDQEGSPVQ